MCGNGSWSLSGASPPPTSAAATPRWWPVPPSASTPRRRVPWAPPSASSGRMPERTRGRCWLRSGPGGRRPSSCAIPTIPPARSGRRGAAPHRTRLCRDGLLVVDEAYLEFVPGAGSLIPERSDNVVVLRSNDQGLRHARSGGWATRVGASSVISSLRLVRPAWSVNALAQAGGLAALRDADFLRRTMPNIWADSRALRVPSMARVLHACQPGALLLGRGGRRRSASGDASSGTVYWCVIAPPWAFPARPREPAEPPRRREPSSRSSGRNHLHRRILFVRPARPSGT